MPWSVNSILIARFVSVGTGGTKFATIARGSTFSGILDMKLGRCLPALLASGLAAAAVCTVHAQDYPTRPIRLIVPFAPGGPVDILSRSIGERLGASFGKQIVVDNRGGASGTIGAELVARAA